MRKRARFSNGFELCRNTGKAYTHAWQVIVTGKDKEYADWGFSGSEALAQKSAQAAENFFLRNGYRDARTEIVRVFCL
jgi:hypothetical protein